MENEHSDLIIGYLQGRLQGRSLDDFYVWVNENAENKRLFFETKALYEASLPFHKASEIHDSWLRLLDKRKSRQRKRFSLLIRISTYAAVAMFATAITSIAFVFSSREYGTQITSYVGGNGIEADVIVLPDGTRVSLGTQTSFSYDSRYGKSERVVQLEGEANFEVTKEKNKPFIVKTKEQSIEALGTKFNVSAYPTDSLLTTTLLEGSVLLTTQNLLHPTILKPNEQFIYNKKTQLTILQQVDANQFVSWTTGYYFFPEQSLEAILYRLSHVYGVQFTIESETLSRRTFTGTFYRGQSIKDIMEIIHLSIPIRYKIDDHHVTISEI
ncbi:FecR family protein [Parabacteroides massiliensis]|uniref:FecR family protein n=1 Tax=Parabacteroides massiliensis TaxID=1750560 RepID=UPI00096A422D|nr:FecR domain-containing protein [Parabacteroides massiliensis]